MAANPGGGAAGPRRELAAVLLGGAAGAGLVLLATRQALARVTVSPPRPLPASITPVTWQDLRPAIAALAVAGLASLAAVLATRGAARRITGIVIVGLGGWIALTAAGRVTMAEALAAAARASASPATGAGAGTAAGSVTAGSAAGGAGGVSLSGLPVHVAYAGAGWRGAMLAGAVLLIAAGVAVVLRAARLPAMSSRFERSARPGPDVALPGAAEQAAARQPARTGRGKAPGMWESLSAGEDPTSWAE